MNPETPSWTDQLSAWSTFATALLTVFLLVAAIWAAVVAVKAMQASQAASAAAQEANEQAKRDSIEQTRPYVYAEVIPSLSGLTNYDLRIVNVGKSAARNLTLTFSEWPEKPDQVTEKVRSLFDTSRTLPPGCSIRSFWRLGPQSTVMGMGTEGIIKVQYSSDDPSHPVYTDTFDIHLDDSGYWPVPDAGPNPDKLEQSERLFYKLGQTIARHIGELSR